jgi:hypothetical protein
MIELDYFCGLRMPVTFVNYILRRPQVLMMGLLLEMRAPTNILTQSWGGLCYARKRVGGLVLENSTLGLQPLWLSPHQRSNVEWGTTGHSPVPHM